MESHRSRSGAYPAEGTPASSTGLVALGDALSPCTHNEASTLQLDALGLALLDCALVVLEEVFLMSTAPGLRKLLECPALECRGLWVRLAVLAVCGWLHVGATLGTARPACHGVLAALATTSNADGTISLVLVECAHATSGMSSPDFGLDASKICCFAITLGGCFFGTLAGDAVLVVDAVAWNWSAFHASTLGGLFANFEAAQWAACERDLQEQAR